MSVIGSKTTILSVGMSCQTSFQIRNQVDLLRNVTGDRTLEVKSLPFDWLICPPLSALSLLSSDQYFPDLHELTMRKRPYWKKHNLFFWHAFRNEERKFEIESTFDSVRSVTLPRWERFWPATKNDRVIFFVSNTQNDLAAHCRRGKAFEPIFKVSELNAFAEGMRTIFGTRMELNVVTRDDRFQTDCEPAGFTLYKHQIDETKWEGDVGQWAATFTSSCAPRTLEGHREGVAA